MTDRTNEAVYQDSKSRWHIKVQYDGERKSFYSSVVEKKEKGEKGFKEFMKGKVEAERKADKWLENHHQNENIRFSKLWEMFLAEKKKLTGTSNHRQLEYLGKYYLSPTIKTKKVVSITNQDWQDCINSAYEKGLSKKTCKLIRGAITSFYKYAKKSRIPLEYPDDLIIPKDAPVKEKAILQPNDIKKVFNIDYINRYGKQKKCFYIHAWRFLIFTGLRRGELCGLKTEDIKGDILYVKRAINGDKEETDGKNDNAIRYMVLTEHAKAVLSEQAQLLKRSGIIHSKWLFPGEDGGRMDPNHLYGHWRTYRDQHGIKSSIHGMRHTMISVSQADVPKELLKRVVGHSDSMDTFGIYGHEVDGDMVKVANILDNVFTTLLK